jgi:hypothetical protein
MKSPKPATDNRFKKLKATFEIEQCWIFAHCGGHFENGDR